MHPHPHKYPFSGEFKFKVCQKLKYKVIICKINVPTRANEFLFHSTTIFISSSLLQQPYRLQDAICSAITHDLGQYILRKTRILQVSLSSCSLPFFYLGNVYCIRIPIPIHMLQHHLTFVEDPLGTVEEEHVPSEEGRNSLNTYTGKRKRMCSWMIQGDLSINALRSHNVICFLNRSFGFDFLSST